MVDQITKKQRAKTLKSLLLLLMCSAVLSAQTQIAPSKVGVYTRAYNNARTGSNDYETILTASQIKQHGITISHVISLGNADARGTESFPLLMPNLRMLDGSVHDVLFVSTLANEVYGFDANTGKTLWKTVLGTPVKSSSAIDFHQINDKIGVLSTGVIDSSTAWAYVVATISDDGSPQKGMQYIFTIDLRSGKVVHVPVSLAGVKDGQQRFNSAMRKQRASLTMTNVNGVKTIFIPTGSILETASGSSGWVVAYDVKSNTISAAKSVTQGYGGGIWMGGQALAANKAGQLFGLSGNGAYDGVNNWAESLFKMQYTPPTSTSPAKFAFVDAFSPFSDAGKVGEDPTLVFPRLRLAIKGKLKALFSRQLAGESLPTEEAKAVPVGGNMKMAMVKTKTVKMVRKDGVVVDLVYPARPADPAWGDEDLGSAGGTLIEAYDDYIGGGKDGLLYSVRASNMGHTMPKDFANAKANCAKLKDTPVWAVYSPGPVDSCPQNQATLDFMPWGKTRHIHATPVQYNSPSRGMELLIWGENSQAHLWGVSPAGKLSYVAQGNELASPDVQNSPGGMPGGFCSVATKGQFAVCAVPYGDGNAQLTTARIVVYDLENLQSNQDGSKTLQTIWDSQQWGWRIPFNKFMPPMIANGMIYYPTYDSKIWALSLVK